MKMTLMLLVAGFMLMGTNLYAADGDLIVNGKLGIGTTNPGAWQLNIATSPSTSGAVLLGTPGGYPGMAILDTSGAQVSNIVARNNGTLIGPTASSGLFVNSASNVGIGTTSPVEKLTVVQGTTGYDVLKLRNTASNAVMSLNPAPTYNSYFDNQTIGANLNFRVSNAEVLDTKALMIKSNGYVGIGVGMTNPLYPLDVAGVIRANNVAPPSDRRFKDNITSIESPLNKVLSMEGVTFNWKREEFKKQNFPEGRHYGVIAQEMEKVLPEVVLTASDGSKSVAYMEIIPVLIEAIKEQQKEIEALKKILMEGKKDE